ncbi:MAG: hypothetical protein HFE90_07890 [Firmicutes bacterium]|nr:hypothetical protein [Bacillota bacterium]
MFKVAANCTLIIAEGVTLTGRKDNTGSIIFVDGGTLEMNGGTITGNHKGTPLNESKTDYSTIKNKEYTYNGAGVYIESGNFIMNSGIIKDNHTIYYEYGGLPYTTQENQKIINNYTFFDVNNKYYRPVGQGGGVYIKAGNFTMIGGTIEDNHAGEGGGIFVDENATFIMGDEKNNTSTGSVNDNIAYLGEGGGIYVRSNIDKNSTITHGNIIGNKTMAVEDLGGGIYVESGYKLTIKNALITNNVAAGLGGGIAACVHGKTSIVNDDGAAIYDNKSLYSKDDKTYEGIQYGVGFVRNQNMSRYAQFNYGNKDWYDLIDSYTKWKENSNFQNAAQDFFSAGSNAEVTNNDTQIPGAIISGEMTGGGYANWSGYSVNNEASNSADSYQGWSISESDKINKTNNSLIYSGKLAALTSSPSDKDKSKATSSAKVIIKGNKSINTHGGGIATNGILVLGTVKSDKTIEGFNFGLDQKAIKKLEGDELEADKFEFELVAGDSNNNGAYVSEKEAIASAKNSANGDINFQITAKELSDFDELDPNKTYTFYMREKVDPKVSDIDFDKSVYKIVVKLKHDKDESVTVGSTSDNNYTIKYYIGEI